MEAEVSDELAHIMVVLAEGYGVRLTETRIRLYGQALADLSLAQLKVAAARAVKECRFFPSVAELRGFVEPSVDDAAALAWTAFGQAAARVGAWAPLVVEDLAAAAALGQVVGSWPAFCALDAHELRDRRSEFVVAYRQARRTLLPHDGPHVMPGLTAGAPGWGWQGRLTAGGAVEVQRALPGAARAQLDEAPVEEL